MAAALEDSDQMYHNNGDYNKEKNIVLKKMK